MVRKAMPCPNCRVLALPLVLVGFAIGCGSAPPSGRDDALYQTLDGGRTWTHVEMGRAVNKIRLLTAARGLVGYAIGADVYKLDTGAARPGS